MALQWKHEGSICMWATEDRWPNRVTNANTKHALAQVHEHSKTHAREHRPLMELHWRKCLPKHRRALGNADIGNDALVCAHNNFCGPSREHKHSLLLTSLNYFYLHYKPLRKLNCMRLYTSTCILSRSCFVLCCWKTKKSNIAPKKSTERPHYTETSQNEETNRIPFTLTYHPQNLAVKMSFSKTLQFQQWSRN